MDRNEAIKIVKSHYPANKQMLNEALEFLIPELKESEDERIRKEIIKYLEQTVPHNHRDEVLKSKEWTAWLEKQGREKPQRMISAEAKEALYDKPDWSEKDENVLEDIEEAIINYWHGDTQDILLDWLKSLKERIGE